MNSKNEDEDGPSSPTLHTLKTLERTWTCSSNESIQQWIDSLTEADWCNAAEERLCSPPLGVTKSAYADMHFLPVPNSGDDELILGAEAKSLSGDGSERGYSMSPRLSPLVDDNSVLWLNSHETGCKNDEGQIVNEQKGRDGYKVKETVDVSNGETSFKPPVKDIGKQQTIDSRQDSVSSFQSISSLFAAMEPDPEDMLISLGFFDDFSSSFHRIPVRFLLNSSQAKGIDVEEFCAQFMDRKTLEANATFEEVRKREITTRFSQSSIDLSLVDYDDNFLAKMRRAKFRQSSIPSITIIDDDPHDGISDETSVARNSGNLRLSTVIEENEPNSRKSSFSKSFSKDKKPCLNKQKSFEVDSNQNDSVFNSIDKEGDGIANEISKQTNDAVPKTEFRIDYCEGEVAKEDLTGEQINASLNDNISNVVDYDTMMIDRDCKETVRSFSIDKNNNSGNKAPEQPSLVDNAGRYADAGKNETCAAELILTCAARQAQTSMPVLVEKETRKRLIPEIDGNLKQNRSNSTDYLQLFEEEPAAMQNGRKCKEELNENEIFDASHLISTPFILESSYPDSIEDSSSQAFDDEGAASQEHQFSGDSLEMSEVSDVKSIDSLDGNEQHCKEVIGETEISQHEIGSPSRIVYRSLGKVENLKSIDDVDSKESSRRRSFGESLKLGGEAIFDNLPFLSKRRSSSRCSLDVKSENLHQKVGEKCSPNTFTGEKWKKRPSSRLRNYFNKLANGKIRSFVSLEKLNTPIEKDRRSKSHEDLLTEKGRDLDSLFGNCLEERLKNEGFARFSKQTHEEQKSRKPNLEKSSSSLQSGYYEGIISDKEYMVPKFENEEHSRIEMDPENRSMTDRMQHSCCNDEKTKESKATGGERFDRNRTKFLSKGFSVESSGFEEETDTCKPSPERGYVDNGKTRLCQNCLEGRINQTISEASPVSSRAPFDTKTTSESSLLLSPLKVDGIGLLNSSPINSQASVNEMNQVDYLAGQLTSLRCEMNEQEDRIKTYIDESMERIKSSILTEISILNASFKTKVSDSSLNGDHK